MTEHTEQRRKPPVLKTHWQVQGVGGRQDNCGGDNRWERRPRLIQQLGGKLRRRVLLSVRWVNILHVRVMMMRFQLYSLFPIVVIQSLSCVQLFVTLWTSACQASPVPHHLLEFAQIHIHRVGDAIQPSHPLLLSSLFAFNLSQHQGLFQWLGCWQQVPKIGASASVLPMSIQGWSPLRLTGWISLQSKGLSRVFSNTAVQKHQFFGVQPSLQFYFLHWTKTREYLLVSPPSRVLWEAAWEITDFCVSPARSDDRGWNPDLLLNSLLLTGHLVTFLNSLPSVSFPHEIEMRPWWL